MSEYNNNILVYDPLKRFKPWFFNLGLFHAQAISFVLIFTGIFDVAWEVFFAQFIFSTFWLYAITHLYKQGKTHWPEWDREFIHIPTMSLTVLMIFWMTMIKGMNEATLLIWIGFFPHVLGRICWRTYTLYSLVIVAYYLRNNYVDWYVSREIFAIDLSYSMGFVALCSYLGMTSENEMNRDVNYLKAEKELQRMTRELDFLSNHDPLTGLLNRRGMSKKYNQFRRNFSAIAIDIDYFKYFNDHYGHNIGDICLVRVAKVLKEVAQDYSNCCVSRYGGEEFLVIFYDTDKHVIKTAAQQLVRAVEGESIDHVKSQVSDSVTISAGVVYTENTSLSLERLWELADTQLYNAKNKGRNRVSFKVDNKCADLDKKSVDTKALAVD